MKKQIFRVFALAFAALLMGGWFVKPIDATGGRDCDDNAVIKCGALSTTELASRINGGGSGPHQSPTELKALFGHYGISTSDFGQLKTGWVQKDGEVWVDHKRVHTGAKSIGRHNIPGSTKLTFVNYPLYLRPTSVSFNSKSLESFVFLNADGSMAFAVIKSCGNIVPGVGKKQVQPKVRGFALKWLDKNADGVWQNDEPRQPGVTFKLTGNGQNQSNVTDSNGYAGFWNLDLNKSYTVTEVVPEGYRSTTGTVKTLTMTGDRAIVRFGNAKIEEKKVNIKIIKFEDCDGDKIIDGDEKLLSDWEFKITGPGGFSKTVTTGANGIVELTGLAAGSYTVTETLKTGWTNTTPLTQTLNIQSDTGVFQFGNKQIPVPKKGSLKIVKFEDKNSNKTKDSDEGLLAGWVFKVTGPNGFNKEVTTGADGTVKLDELTPGDYTVTEILKSGWNNTTGLTLTKTVKAETVEVFKFGNKKEQKPQLKVKLKIIKFEDCDGDKIIDGDEKLLSDWEFKITGPNGYMQTVKTGANGIVELVDLTPGNYTVTEVLKAGWTNTTPLTQTLNIQNDTGVFQFGNKKVEEKVQIKIIKFQDDNNNQKMDENEKNLPDWEFEVKGPNGYSKTVKTGANGEVILTDLASGEYTVTEIRKNGWNNTTDLSIKRVVTTDRETQCFKFGNKPVEDVVVVPETPIGGGPVPVTEAEFVSAPSELPVSGPLEAAGIGFSTLTLTGTFLSYLRSKKRLSSVMK